ncbi:MAG: response regulator [Acidobacteria bacterium]|nr:response regulator [Acidobacteriota bacterium]
MSPESRDHDRPCALVVHSSLTLRKDIAGALSAEDIDTSEASTLAEALELVEAGFLSVVITAFELPDGDARRLIEELRNSAGRLETPCILLCEPEEQLHIPYDEQLYTVPLPYERGELVTLAVQIAPAPPAGGTVCDATRLTVLAVDDSETYLGALTDALESEELEVLTATTGEKALSVLGSQRVQAILLDLTLPGISGQELCRRLRHNPRYRRTPIIMLTADEKPDTMFAGLQAGADDFIAKSADFEVVRARLRVQLRRQKLEEENRQAKERAFHLEQQRRVNEILAREGERLRLAMESAELGGWEWDLEQPQISPTGAFRRLFGFDDGVEKISVREVLRRIHPDHRAPLRQLLDAAASDVEAGVELRLTPNAGDRWLQVRGKTAELPDGRPRLFGVVGDITVRKRREEEQRVLAELQSHLMSIVGHDLRSPLSAIVTASAVLEATLDGGGAQGKMLSIIKNSTDRAVRLIETLLDYSKARFGGGIPTDPRTASLHEVTSQVIHEAHVAHPDRDIRFERRGEGTAVFDPDRLGQVASNLLANALNHGDPEQPIEVVSEIDTDELVIRVSNRGPAIPQAARATLFEPFRRASDSPGGLGLGLYIVRSIAEAHAGRVEVTSTEEEGTTFEVRLPRRQPGDPIPDGDGQRGERASGMA